MIRTFDFIYELKRTEEKRNMVISLMEQKIHTTIDIGGHSIRFIPNRNIALISCNRTDPTLKERFIPAEISYDSLKQLITDKNLDKPLDIKWL